MSTSAESVFTPTENQTAPVADWAQTLAYYVTSDVGKMSDTTATKRASVVLDAMDSSEYAVNDWNEKLGLTAGNPLGTLVLRVLSERASENDLVLEASKALESVFREKLNADGKGLHTYVSNHEHQLPEQLVSALRWIATVRNAVVHGDGSGLKTIHDKAQYAVQAARCWDWLGRVANSNSPVNDDVLSQKRRISLKIEMVNPKIAFIIWLTMIGGALTAILSWSYLFTRDWSNHPNVVDDFWLGVVLFVVPPIIGFFLPKKEREFPLLEIKKRNPGKQNKQTLNS
ncbi:hypothetical protein ACJU26_09115 [Acidithiobacillus sp. M4-SHS-6]|uniref:hypothetical protein n=1 Tax=Acidithiobacillus sp. M4-SHS-6 TaxID=3383024 RepID=UPI0039BDA46E